MSQCVCGIGKRAAAILSAPHMRAHTQVRPCGKRQSLPRYFGGVAPTAARRARPVQRGGFQGLRGNPDACRPRRGSACKETAGKTGVDTRPVSALSVQRTAAMSPRFWGAGGGTPAPSFPPFLREEMGAPSSAQAADRSLPGRPESSFPPLGLLSPRRPLRWVAAGAPLGAPREGATSMGGRPQVAPTDGAPSRRAPRGQRLRGQTGG